MKVKILDYVDNTRVHFSMEVMAEFKLFNAFL